MFEGLGERGYARGHVSIFDTSLTKIRQVRTSNGISNSDQHESHLSQNGQAALLTVYNPERYDLSEQNITNGQGWIQNCIFQRINIDSGELMFEWSAIEHVALSEGYVFPNSTEVVGSGTSSDSPWDYFHMNSIDENDDGDYIISARHTNTLYKINGQNGQIMWRLGGRLSDFSFDQGLNFSSQHDARWLTTNETTDIISLFDNASNGFQGTANRSQGMVLKLDHTRNPPFCSLLRSFRSPDDPADSSASQSNSQGNIRLFDPANYETSGAFANWGNRPYVTEYDSSGNLIFQANIESGYACGPMNYRGYKVDVTLTPRDTPALYTYARTDNSSTIYYMSWNGATEVTQWRVYGKTQCRGRWNVLGTIEKTGFETTYIADSFHEIGLVEALDVDGNGLRNSSTRGTRTFVPGSLLVSSCDDMGCDTATEYVPAEQQITIAEMRPGCAAPGGVYGQSAMVSENGTGSGSSGSGSGGSTGGDAENAAAQLVGMVGKYWGWILLLLGVWSVVV